MLDVSLLVRRGPFTLDIAFRSDAGVTALFGRSGSGKSTALAAVAGLVRPQAGHVVVDGQTLHGGHRFLPPHRRRLGLVFQDAHLFPHLSVAGNLDYGAWFARRLSGGPSGGVERAAVLDTLGIGPLLTRRPAQLSGGERQRVAIGRALLSRPRALLMDEPLASLDAARKLEILPLIERLRDELRIPILYVSHAAGEVARLAGHVVVIEAGRVLRQGLPAAVLASVDAPLLEARLDAVSPLTARMGAYDEAYGLSTLDHPAGSLAVPGRAGPPGAPVRLAVRGTDVSLALERPTGLSLRTILEGRVRTVSGDAGPLVRVEVELRGGDALGAYVTRRSADELGLRAGTPVHCLVKAASVDGAAGPL